MKLQEIHETQVLENEEILREKRKQILMQRSIEILENNYEAIIKVNDEIKDVMCKRISEEEIWRSLEA